MTRLLGILTLVLSCSASSFAQGVQTGTLRGTVKDQQGLPLPGATITATSPALQGERTAVTDTEGAYLFRALPPGGARWEYHSVPGSAGSRAIKPIEPQRHREHREEKTEKTFCRVGRVCETHTHQAKVDSNGGVLFQFEVTHRFNLEEGASPP